MTRRKRKGHSAFDSIDHRQLVLQQGNPSPRTVLNSSHALDSESIGFPIEMHVEKLKERDVC